MASAATDSEDASRRLGVVAGTEHYGAGLRDLSHVPREVALVRSVLGDMGMDIQDGLALDPSADDLRRVLSRAMDDGTRTPHDTVVFYYSGHGYTTNTGGYRLATFRGSYGTSDDFATSISAHELAEIVNEPGPAQVVVVVDACESGAAGDAFRHLQDMITALRGKGPDVYLITAADRIEEAHQMAFADAFAAALRTPGVPTGMRYIEATALCRDINYRMRMRGAGQTAQCAPSPAAAHRALRAFPNPQYARQRPQHLPEAAEGSGWAFCGRKRAAHELVQHVSGVDPDPRPIVVTGPAGWGKSTLLAWLATASDGQPLPTADGPAAERVPEGCAVLVQARGQPWQSVLRDIGNELGVSYRGPEPFFRALADLPTLTGVLIDSVNRVGALDTDENDPTVVQTFVEQVLVPLSQVDTVRLVVAAEAPLGAIDMREIPLADAEYFEPADLDMLVRGVLTGRSGSLHRHAPGHALDRMAAGVRERSEGSFLRAYLFAVDLTGREPTEDEAAVQSSMVDVFQQQLTRVKRDDPTWARDLLTPLALALGPGMPDFPLWMDIVHRLSGREVDHAGLEHLLRVAGEYIADSPAGPGRAGWQLRRDEFASSLAQRHDLTEAHAAFTEALLSTLGLGEDRRPRWNTADEYARRNFAEHAQRAGVLDGFLLDPDFLFSVDPLRLRRALTLSGTPRARDVRNVLDLIHDRDRSDGCDLARLQFLALAHDQTELARNAAQANGKWTSAWLHRAPADEVTVVPGVRGGGYVVVGTQDGGALVGERNRTGLRELQSADDPVSASGAGLWNGRPLAALGTWSGRLTLHELDTGRHHSLEDAVPDFHRVVTCEVGEHGLLVATAHAWRRYGTAGGDERHVDTDGLVLASAATATVAGEHRTVGCSSGRVAVWEADGRLSHTFRTPQSRALTRIVAHEDRIYTASDDGTVCASSLDGTDQRVVARHADQPVTSMRVLRTAKGTSLLTTGLDGTLRVAALERHRQGEPAVPVDVGLGIKAADLEDEATLIVCTNHGTARIRL
ncbi:caspase family protein [Streptomyces ziwulingensis]|uniref:Peptidase C14 caspase domain-containing protein n=1 Tax=Streptomyces ziwulingensis TaxID=1045501 RepID=A0ABP9CLR4_9ACTN